MVVFLADAWGFEGPRGVALQGQAIMSRPGGHAWVNDSAAGDDLVLNCRPAAMELRLAALPGVEWLRLAFGVCARRLAHGLDLATRDRTPGRDRTAGGTAPPGRDRTAGQIFATKGSLWTGFDRCAALEHFFNPTKTRRPR